MKVSERITMVENKVAELNEHILKVTDLNERLLNQAGPITVSKRKENEGLTEKELELVYRCVKKAYDETSAELLRVMPYDAVRNAKIVIELNFMQEKLRKMLSYRPLP